MATDLTVLLGHQPGTLAAMGRALGGAGVNIDGICGVSSGGQGVIHVLVDDAPAARSALEGAGIEVSAETEVVTAGFDDRPGELGEMAGRVADAGTNIELVYVSCDGRLVLGVDDTAAATQALG